MFKNNDKLNLVLINASDIDGNLIPFSLKLPLDNLKFTLPEELTSIDLFEYQEGSTHYGNIIYRIYIGKKTTFENIIPELSKTVTLKNDLKIPSLKTPICYQEIATTKETDKEKIIYAVLNESDVVVENHQELMSTIESLSVSFKHLRQHISHIKKLTLDKETTTKTVRS